ncbi:MAG: hypothetical protein PUC82_04885 [bacterium]|nr:hypothetical protein [bacterium]
MGVFEKLKNALFEEEYVEVEEKPRVKQAPKKNKVKEIKRESVREDIKDKYRDEKPIAKKIVLPEKKDSYPEKLEEDIDDVDDKEVEEVVEKRQFRIMDDSDFTVDADEKIEKPDVEPQIVKVIEKEPTPYGYESDNLYHGRVPNQPYGTTSSPKSTVSDYRIYEAKKEETHFKPSPIISPIYGILDKNYKKEDVVQKREVRFTSSFAREKLNVDDVREKAFGAVSDDATAKVETREETIKPTFDVAESTSVVDLSSEESKPAVKEVTVGDAVEYFEDLGLEYNVDYLDASKKASGRRVKDTYDSDNNSEVYDTDAEPKLVDAGNETTDDDNLFDLIDSMYQEQE